MGYRQLKVTPECCKSGTASEAHCSRWKVSLEQVRVPMLQVRGNRGRVCCVFRRISTMRHGRRGQSVPSGREDNLREGRVWGFTLISLVSGIRGAPRGPLKKINRCQDFA